MVENDTLGLPSAGESHLNATLRSLHHSLIRFGAAPTPADHLASQLDPDRGGAFPGASFDGGSVESDCGKKNFPVRPLEHTLVPASQRY